MNFNFFPPNPAKSSPLPSPMCANTNNQISYNHTSYHYYPAPASFNSQIPPINSIPSLPPKGFADTSMHKTKSMSSLHRITPETVGIANHLRVSTDDMNCRNLDNNNYGSYYENNQCFPYFRNVTSQNEVNVSMPIYYSQNINIINNPKGYSYSDEFLVKRNEEDVLSDEMEKGFIKSPMVVKINQRAQNNKLLIIESKRKQLNELEKQNNIMKLELKKQMELKVRSQLIESLLVENKMLNTLLKSKLIETAERQKKNISPIRSSANIKTIDNLELKNQELRNQLIEFEILERSKIRLLKKIQEKKEELASISEEIQIKDITHQIQRLNDANGKVKESINMISQKIPELFNLIRQEFQINN